MLDGHIRLNYGGDRVQLCAMDTVNGVSRVPENITTKWMLDADCEMNRFGELAAIALSRGFRVKAGTEAVVAC